MTTLDAVWGTKRTELKDGYLDSNGETASCWAIARDIADALHEDGRPIQLLTLQSEGTTVHTVLGSDLRPTPYPNLSWLYHYVCRVGDVVYDPMLEDPLQFTDYPEAAFSVGALAVVETELWVPQNSIQK